MGCHSRVEDQIDEVRVGRLRNGDLVFLNALLCQLCPEGIVTVSLDEGTVLMDRELPVPLPSHAVDLFKSR